MENDLKDNRKRIEFDSRTDIHNKNEGTMNEDTLIKIKIKRRMDSCKLKDNKLLSIRNYELIIK